MSNLSFTSPFVQSEPIAIPPKRRLNRLARAQGLNLRSLPQALPVRNLSSQLSDVRVSAPKFHPCLLEKVTRRDGKIFAHVKWEENNARQALPMNQCSEGLLQECLERVLDDNNILRRDNEAGSAPLEEALGAAYARIMKLEEDNKRIRVHMQTGLELVNEVHEASEKRVATIKAERDAMATQIGVLEFKIEQVRDFLQ